MINTAAYIHTATTTHLVPIGQGLVVHTVLIPVATSGTVTFQSPGGAITYFVLPASTVANSYLLDSICSNGLDVVTTAGDVVIVTAGA